MKPGLFSGSVKLDGRKVGWISTFPKGSGFDCARCGLCCYGRIGLTRGDLDGFKKAGLGTAVAEVKVIPLTPYDARMRNKADGSCVNLRKDNLCAIYDVRPTVCRTFPFFLTGDCEGNAALDVVLKCPFVDFAPGKADKPAPAGGRAKPIEKKQLEEVVSLFSKSVPGMVLNTIAYQTSLASHIRSVVPAAFPPRDARVSFMGKAIEMLRLPSPRDIAGAARMWADDLSVATHTLMITRCPGAFPTDEVMLAGVRAEEGRHEVDRKRLANALADLKGTLVYSDGEKVERVRAALKEGLIDVGGKKMPLERLSRLEYTDGAVGILLDYLKMLDRRPSMQLCIERAAGYIVDYMSVSVTGFELEAAILGNGVVQDLDLLARTIAAYGGHDAVDGWDMRLAIASADQPIIQSLINDTVMRELVAGIRKDLAKRPGFA